ncbi:hypothetical protein ES703_10782 [subsurface metagenome]
MNPIGKKFISLFLVFSLMTLSINLYAKERRGAKLSVWTKGGQKVKGELIAVKEDSLLLLESESGADVSVNVKDIIEIRTVKKSSVKTGFISGLIIGVIGGALWVVGTLAVEAASDGEKTGLGNGLLVAGGATLVGGAIGQMAGSRRYVFATMTDSEIQETLDKLRKKARIRDYK